MDDPDAAMTPEQHARTAELFLSPEHDTPEEIVTQFGILAAAHALTGLLRLALKETMP